MVVKIVIIKFPVSEDYYHSLITLEFKKTKKKNKTHSLKTNNHRKNRKVSSKIKTSS